MIRRWEALPNGEMVFQHPIMVPEAFPDLRIILFIPGQGSP
jgi:hypothetical protein